MVGGYFEAMRQGGRAAEQQGDKVAVGGRGGWGEQRVASSE